MHQSAQKLENGLRQLVGVNELLEAARAKNDYKSIGLLAAKAAEIEAQIADAREALGKDHETEFQQRLKAAERAEREALAAFNKACAARDEKQREFAREAAAKLIPYQEAAEQALAKKRAAASHANEMRSKLQEAQAELARAVQKSMPVAEGAWA